MTECKVEGHMQLVRWTISEMVSALAWWLITITITNWYSVNRTALPCPYLSISRSWTTLIQCHFNCWCREASYVHRGHAIWL